MNEYGHPGLIKGPKYGCSGIIYGPEYGQPGIINGPEYGQPRIMDNHVGHDNHLYTKFAEIDCRCLDTVILGRHSARGIHSITLNETHDENMVSFESRRKTRKRHA